MMFLIIMCSLLSCCMQAVVSENPEPARALFVKAMKLERMISDALSRERDSIEVMYVEGKGVKRGCVWNVESFAPSSVPGRKTCADCVRFLLHTQTPISWSGDTLEGLSFRCDSFSGAVRRRLRFDVENGCNVRPLGDLCPLTGGDCLFLSREWTVVRSQDDGIIPRSEPALFLTMGDLTFEA